MPDHLPRPAGLDADIERAQAGDEAAFGTLYRAQSPRLLAYIRSIVGDADADDVAAETWAAIAQGLPRFRGDEDGFRGWTSIIARHRALDHLRRRRPFLPMPPEKLPAIAAPDDTARDAVDAVATTAALRLISGLPREQARAVLLQVIVGLNSPTAARVLGKKPDSIRAATHRGLRNLARLLRTAVPSPPLSDVAQSSAPAP